MPAIVPTLSSDKWVRDPKKKLTNLFFYARTANHSQSVDQPNGVCSITAICAEYAMNMSGLEDNLRDRLGSYLDPYFDEVNISVTNSTADKGASKQTIDLDIVVKQDGMSVSLGTVLAGDLDDQARFTLNKITDRY